MNKKILMSILVVVIAGMIFSFAYAADTEIISLSLVNQDPDPAIAGDILEIRIGIENQGGSAAEEIMLEVADDYPFTKLSGENLVKEVGTIKAYQTGSDMKIVKFRLRIDRDATAGQYELKVKRYTSGMESVSAQSKFNIDIKNKESAEVIYIDQVELIPGRITPLKFTVNNVGSAPLRDLTFQWENADDIILPVGSDNTKYIKYIDVGDSADLNFNVIASAIADPNLYKLDLKLSYDNPITGEFVEINTKAGVYVGGETDFDAAFSGVSSGESSFSISNIGSVAASSVTVKIPEQTGWRVTGSNSVIIGNLNEGDYTIASFKLQQQFTGATDSQTQTRLARDANNATQRFAQTQDQTVKLQIIYTDSRGNRNTIEKDVPVDASSFMAASTDGTATTGATNFAYGRIRRQSTAARIWNIAKWLVPLILLIVLSILGYKKYKREKIKDHNYTYGKLWKETFSLIKDKLKFKKKKKKETSHVRVTK